MPGWSAVFEGLFPSLLITFREALEASLIIAIMISYSRKVGRGEMNTYVYVESVDAVLASLLLGFVQLAYGELEGVSEQLFEGGASLTAVVVLTYMIFWMARRSAGIRGELEERMGAALTRGELYGVSLLAFVSVFREGIETVLFLTSAFLLDPPGALSALPWEPPQSWRSWCSS